MLVANKLTEQEHGNTYMKNLNEGEDDEINDLHDPRNWIIPEIIEDNDFEFSMRQELTELPSLSPSPSFWVDSPQHQCPSSSVPDEAIVQTQTQSKKKRSYRRENNYLLQQKIDCIEPQQQHYSATGRAMRLKKDTKDLVEFYDSKQKKWLDLPKDDPRVAEPEKRSKYKKIGRRSKPTPAKGNAEADLPDTSTVNEEEDSIHSLEVVEEHDPKTTNTNSSATYNSDDGYPWEDPPVQTKSGRLVKKLKGRLSQDKNWMKEVSSRAVFENCILNRSPTDHDVIYDDGEDHCSREWTADENDKLLAIVGKHGPSNWTAIARMFRSRTAVACKKQWISLAWTDEDNLTLYLAQRFFGNAWKEMACLFPGWEKDFLGKKWETTKMRTWLIERGLLRGTGSVVHIKTKAGMQAALDGFKRAVAQKGHRLRVDMSAVTVILRFGRPLLQVDTEVAAAARVEVLGRGGVGEAVRSSSSASESSKSPEVAMLPHPLYAEGKAKEDDKQEGYWNELNEEEGDMEDGDDDDDDDYNEGEKEEEAIEVGGQGDDDEEEEEHKNCGYDGGLEDDQTAVRYNYDTLKVVTSVQAPSHNPSANYLHKWSVGRLPVPVYPSTRSTSSSAPSTVHQRKSDSDPLTVFSHVYRNVLTLMKEREPDMLRIKVALTEQCGWNVIYSSAITRSYILAPWIPNTKNFATWRAGNTTGFVYWLDYFYGESQLEDMRILQALRSEHYQRKCAEFITSSRSGAKECLPAPQASDSSTRFGLIPASTSNPTTSYGACSPQPSAFAYASASASFLDVFQELKKRGWTSRPTFPDEISHLESNVSGYSRVYLRPGKKLSDRSLILNEDYFYSEQAVLRYLQSSLGIKKTNSSAHYTDDRVEPSIDNPIADTAEELAVDSTSDLCVVEAKKRPLEEVVSEEDSAVAAKKKVRSSSHSYFPETETFVGGSKKETAPLPLADAFSEEYSDMSRSSSVGTCGSGSVTLNQPDSRNQDLQFHGVEKMVTTSSILHTLTDANTPPPTTLLLPSEEKTNNGAAAMAASHVSLPLSSDRIVQEGSASLLSSSNLPSPSVTQEDNTTNVSMPAQPYILVTSPHSSTDPNSPSTTFLLLSSEEKAKDEVGATSVNCDSPRAALTSSHVVSPLYSDRAIQEGSVSLFSSSNSPPPTVTQEDNVNYESTPVQPYILATQIATISHTTTTTSSTTQSDKIEEYWKVQLKKFKKGLLLPVVYEDSCLDKVNHAYNRGKITDDDRESLQTKFIQSLSDYHLPSPSTSVEESTQKLLEKLRAMYERRFIGLSVLEDVYLARLIGFHEQGCINTSELQRLQWIFEKSQEKWLDE